MSTPAKSDPSVLEELRALEPIFHRMPASADRAAFEPLVAEGFWEVGASGTVYSRDHVLDALAGRPETPHDAEWTIEDFDARALADGLWLVTYSLEQDRDRRSRRTTIWRRAASGWRAEFHQGTLV